MVDIQSATAEIRRGKKRERQKKKKKKPQGKNIVACAIPQGGRNEARYNGVAVALAGPYANHLHLTTNR